MVLGIDHIVIAVRDLEVAVADYTRLGFTVIRGGRHAGLNTHNALIAFADGAYLELIAFLDPVPAKPHWWFEALQHGGGLIDFCVRSDDLQSDAACFRSAGVRVGEPFTMSRERPDGYRLNWTLTVVEDDFRAVMPFFISDITPRAQRVPGEQRHPNGAMGLKSLTIVVANPEPVIEVYKAALKESSHSISRTDLGAAGACFVLGSHELQIVAPADSFSFAEEHLSRRGPSPLEVRLRGATGDQRILDAELTHSARIALC